MRELLVRTAQPSEQRALEALQWRASLSNPGDREALLANPDAIELDPAQIADGLVFVAETEETILGFATILPREDGNAELDALFVEPDAWRQGIGRRLVDHCAQVSRSKGWATMHVVGNPHAELFYRSCGFQILGTEQTRFGIGLLMSKPL